MVVDVGSVAVVALVFVLIVGHSAVLTSGLEPAILMVLDKGSEMKAGSPPPH
jgi:hypothetical protein